MNDDNKIIFIIGLIVVIWLALVYAPYLDNGLLEFIQNSNEIDYFKISFSDSSIRTILAFTGIYITGVSCYISTKRNYRKDGEHGTAKWGSPSMVNSKYMQKPISENKILTQHVCLGLNGKKHRRNLNVLVCGGSGAGKTRFYCKPNILQCNSSFIVLDPKGELLRDTANLLKQNGYAIKVLDLINMERSDCYNPFVYLRNDNDVQKLVTNLFKATDTKDKKGGDPFWDVSAQMLLMALILYVKYEALPNEQTFSMVMDMLRIGNVDENDSEQESPLDILFDKLETKNPNHIALKYYRNYRSGASKTLKSIQITLMARLEKFNLDSLAKITQNDELDLPSIGEKKTALFALIPDNDTSFNFLVSILYTQLFQQLFYLADHKYGGSLPVHVHFVMDEFSNVRVPDDFEKILSVMRSRNVSVSIILQNLSQLKALFEKQWESIVGNCDTFLYLGGNEQSTHKYVSELLGKETITFNTNNTTKGQSSSYAVSYQLTGRELLTPDEVRLLDNKYALLFIRGERPIKDLKFDIMKHKNTVYTSDGKSKPYVHKDTIELDTKDNFERYETKDDEIEVLSNENF